MARLLGGDGADWDRAFRWGKRSDLIGQSTARFWRIGATNDAEASSETPSPRSFTFDPGIELNPVLRQRGTISDWTKARRWRLASTEGSPRSASPTKTTARSGTRSCCRNQRSGKGPTGFQLFEVAPFTGGAAEAAPLRLLWSSTDQ